MPQDNSVSNNLSITTLGAGCFWCVEAIFQRVKGVQKVVSGYMGGHLQNPTYQDICNGDSGHAEVTQITFDTSIISFEHLLDVFWATHDPTTLNKQGADVGTQYRSVIFYHDSTQAAIARQSKQKITDLSLFENPIVTEITAAQTFYPAEKYHQDYFNRNTYAPYCMFVISPKVAKFKNSLAVFLKN